jgi:hypothetical protein
MKKTFRFAAFLLLLGSILMTGCGEKEDPIGTIQLNVVTTFNGNDFVMGQTYTGRDQRSYRTGFMRFYLSNINLIKGDNSTISLSEAMLVNEEDATSKSFTIEVPAGDYTGFTYGLGLDAATNAIDPATYEANSPLATGNSMYWSWATKYIFFKYEVEASTTQGGSLDNFAFFHIGGDDFYVPMQKNQAIAVSEENTTTLELRIDYDRIINGVSDYVDVATDNATHTGDNMTLANRIYDNWEAAFVEGN